MRRITRSVKQVPVTQCVCHFAGVQIFPRAASNLTMLMLSFPGNRGLQAGPGDHANGFIAAKWFLLFFCLQCL